MYPPGASGAFIKSMLVYILSDDVVDMDFDAGNSHSYYRNYLKKNIASLLLSANMPTSYKKYKFLADLKSDIVLVDSPKVNNIDIQYIIDSSCDYKLIYIYVNETDFPILSTNHYYKQPATVPYFTELSTKLFNNSDLTTLTLDQEKILINHPEVIHGYEMGKVLLDKWLDDCPDVFRNSLYRIDFNDIIDNKDKVKSLLESLTNKTMSSYAHIQYDRYVERQMQFRKDKQI